MPVTLPTATDATTSYPTPGAVNGPEVVQLGDLTMEIYERITKAPEDDGLFSTTAGPSREILKNAPTIA